MADIRELIILSPGLLDPTPENKFTKVLSGLRMQVRRQVVRLAQVSVFRWIFSRIYDAHIALAVAVGRRFPGTRAIYLTSGLASGDQNIGISDVDIAMYGEWPDAEQFRLLKVFGALTVLLPLFDRRSLGSINTIEDAHVLAATDLHMAMNYERGRGEWKVLYGRDVLSDIPSLSPERFPGAVYANLRRWWAEIAVTTCGTGLVARDAIFIRTICYKTAAEVLRNERMLSEGIDRRSRRQLLVEDFNTSRSPVVGRLLASGEAHFLDRASDPRTETLAWTLQHLEKMHTALRTTPPFIATLPVQVAGSPGQLDIAEVTRRHVEELVKQASSWSEFRSAFLAPVSSMFSPD